MCVPSVADPHWMPPKLLPGPTSVCQTTAPVLGSSAQYSPLFCPMPTSERPDGSWMRLGPLPKSKSGPQVGLGCRPQTLVATSLVSVLLYQRIAPVAMSRASTESAWSSAAGGVQPVWPGAVQTPAG